MSVTTTSPPGTGTNTGTASGDIVGYDLLRAAAAMGVVFIHLWQLFILHGEGALSWGRSGDAGVPIFFVLSGFLIATSILRPSSFDRRSYGLRRAARIMPLYFVVLVIALVFVDPTPLLTASGRSDVLAHVFFLHGMFRGMRYSINGVLWTISIEVFFYALMAVLASVLRHRIGGWVVAGGMVAIGLAWRWIVWSPDGIDTAYAVQQLPGVADLFGVGILLALLVRQAWVGRALQRGIVRVLLAVATAAWLIPVSLSYHRNHTRYWTGHRYVTLWPLLFGVGIAALILCLRENDWLFDRPVVRATVGYVGRISYGVYLLNALVIIALGKAWYARGPQVPVLPFVLVAVAATLLSAAILHHAVEVPAMAWARNRVSARRQAVGSFHHEREAAPVDLLEPEEVPLGVGGLELEQR